MHDIRGFTLVTTLLVMVLISTLILASLGGAMTAIRTTNLDYRSSRVSYAAEAGADAVMAQLSDALDDATLDEDELAAIEAPSLTGFTFDQLQVTKIGGIEIETITDGAFSGLFSLTQRLEIYSKLHDPLGNSSAIIVSAKAQAIPIFQFGIFYEKDLEATNGPSMEFAGWVHSNGNIYLSSNNAWYRDQITTPAKMFHDRKDFHGIYNGVYVNDAGGNEIQLDFDSRSHATPNAFRAVSNDRVDDRIKTDAYEVDTLRVPLPSGIEPVEVIRARELSDSELERKAKFAWKADWYIEVPLNLLADPNDLCDVMVQQRAAGKELPTSADCQDFFAWTPLLFYDAREGKRVLGFQVDVGDLAAWVNVSPGNRSTQILYVTFTGAPGADLPAVILTNGETLPGPFTVATDHPLYTLGHYNRLNWQPAALVGDAYTVLSEAWVHANHTTAQWPANWFAVPATATTVNAAVLAGHVPTPCDHEAAGCSGGYQDFYSGGIENFPRFLENWGGIWLTYTGSLVSLYESQEAVGTWNGSYYGAPKRAWSFDTRFEDPANLPPGTPVVGNVIHTAFRPVH